MLDIDYLLVLDGTVLEWQVLLLFYNYYFGGQIIFDEQQTMLSLFDHHLFNRRLKQKRQDGFSESADPFVTFRPCKKMSLPMYIHTTYYADPPTDQQVLPC